MSEHIGAELRQLPVFSLLPHRALRLAASLVTTVEFEPGDALVHEGGVGREAFVLLSGTATVTRDGTVVATARRGDVIGEVALLNDGYRTATVTADTAVKALVMNPREFNSLLSLRGVRAAVDGAIAARSSAA